MWGAVQGYTGFQDAGGDEGQEGIKSSEDAPDDGDDQYNHWAAFVPPTCIAALNARNGHCSGFGSLSWAACPPRPGLRHAARILHRSECAGRLDRQRVRQMPCAAGAGLRLDSQRPSHLKLRGGGIPLPIMLGPSSPNLSH